VIRDAESSVSSVSNGGDSSSRRAYEVLRRAFVLCEVMPGSQVTESFLAERYGLTRAAVRAALGRLRQQHWIEASPRKGYVVRPLTLKDIRDLYAVRSLLEPAAAEMAARNASESQLAEIGELARVNADDGAGYEAIRDFLEVNTRFHVAVATASGNERIARMLEEVLVEMERMFHFGLASASRSFEMSNEHGKLVDALMSGDPAAASAAVREQLRTSEKMVVDVVLLQNPMLQNVNLAQEAHMKGYAPARIDTEYSRETDKDRL
jgi:DNA-binding GntR family transcriptional regulator